MNRFFAYLLVGLVATFLLASTTTWAQQGGSQESPSNDRASEVLSGPTDSEVAAEQPVSDVPTVRMFDLLTKGGWLMAPIVLMSILVVAIGIERAFGLRESRIIPEELVQQLGKLAESSVFDPRQAYQLCQRYPSSAARVVRAMLLKVGRPHAEVETTVANACQAESDSLYSNVRTLNLAASVTPLLGLLGTVWGMIQAFFVTANLPESSNKGEALAQGIYVALVTTFAGLAVAIPAAVLAHFFEGRILRLLRNVESLAASLLPQVERYEGKLRLDKQRLESEPEKSKSTAPHMQPTPAKN
ncbi:MotA/TolQ/ExbB proton channel family protein [Aeoliella mucimassa]|uniref:Colicin uptake protein TolQ n=1 Tax=Aeoliella mucimassa TaxID=2527972 RepID=A0A518AMQ4_9BACT|nr:MotA/TolQ/ExbB proton channel family protein [Aeoliella mucimassa]QDU55986.1 colicin uptake protein TolQ [Aeoliella mucimassa]